MQLFYYLQLINLIREILRLKENKTKKERAEKKKIRKKIISIPATILNFHTTRDLRSQDEDYNTNVHCRKTKNYGDLTW